MPRFRATLLASTLLLGGCASPAHQQLGVVITGLEGELQRLEEELAAMNGLNYQKAIDAPLSLRRYLKAPSPTPEGLVPLRSQLQDGPRLSYDYRLPAGMSTLPLDNPCQRYEFELRHLGHLGQLELSWQGAGGEGERMIRQTECSFPAKTSEM
ncbi:hypothetical protein LA366_20780 [Aeromonas jandaei]|uniref:Pilus assembly protein PilP n=1 Tax=Aeromonas jandaei TaxID=650 RepID=A0ABX6ZJS5_AERJA|nr:hypothetical protein [Aeromonas jandaei]QQB18770.1 hypothetical protein I6H43_14555 [Aeromonas jandaei]UCA33442.1 hypothetical protein LA366_20780 [Aeromonas jandaei]BCS50637.1 hypothetical protein JUNP479_3417 [Aeromonas jandaei]